MFEYLIFTVTQLRGKSVGKSGGILLLSTFQWIDRRFLCRQPYLSLFCHWVPNNQPTSSADKESLLCRDRVYSCSSQQQPTHHIRTVIEWLLPLLIWGCISSAETNMVVSQRYDFPPEGDDAGSKVIKSGTCLLWWIMIKSQVQERLLSLLFSFLVGQMVSYLT